MRHLLNPTETLIILTCFGIFLNPSTQIQGEYLKRGHGRFLSHPLHFVTFRTLYTVQGLSKAFGKFQECITHIKTRRKFTNNICPKTVVLEVQPPRSPDLGPLDIHLCGRCIQFKLEVKRQITDAILKSVKPFAIAPGPVKWWDSPWSTVSVRALNYVGDILSIYCELWLDKQ
jgi:hypothetical protein